MKLALAVKTRLESIMSGAAYRSADQTLVFQVADSISSQQTRVTNTYIRHQSSVSSTHSTGSKSRLSSGSKQDSVQDVEINPTVSTIFYFDRIQVRSYIDSQSGLLSLKVPLHFLLMSKSMLLLGRHIQKVMLRSMMMTMTQMTTWKARREVHGAVGSTSCCRC